MTRACGTVEAQLSLQFVSETTGDGVAGVGACEVAADRQRSSRSANWSKDMVIPAKRSLFDQVRVPLLAVVGSCAASG